MVEDSLVSQINISRAECHCPSSCICAQLIILDVLSTTCIGHIIFHSKTTYSALVSVASVGMMMVNVHSHIKLFFSLIS